MVEEKYCSFEIAKLLKEKKFDIPSLRWYDKDGNVVAKLTTPKTPLDYFKDEYYYLCPTHQMAMAWLREKHNIHIEIEAYPHEDGCFYWHYRIMEMVKYKDMFGYFKRDQKAGFDSYEDAVEAGIKQYIKTQL